METDFQHRNCTDHQWVDPGYCGICHEKEPKGPEFLTMFTIVGISQAVENDVTMFTAKTAEGSTILAGKYADGHFGAQVVGPIGASRGEYNGPEVERVFTELKASWEEIVS